MRHVKMILKLINSSKSPNNMHKEQFKTEKVKFLVSMNEKMKSILDKYHIDYKSLQTLDLPSELKKHLESGIEKRNDINCYTYKSIEKFELFYPDSTGNEYSNNKVHIDTNCGITKALGVSLNFAFTIVGLLDAFNHSFDIVISYDGADFTISFYRKRDNEEWLMDDLDSYTEEAIMVITT